MSFESRLTDVSSPSFMKALCNIKHGVERETLRVNGDGTIASNPHPEALGAALTHEWITTDFSESLLEFITPPENMVTTSVSQLIDIHKFTYESIGEQYLWPMSMPCFISSETNIPIAQYGSSNIARMKEVYREGLHNRYGSMMQVISGVHFNFSLPDEFWQKWCEMHGETWNKETQSAHYFGLVRNFKRFAWIIPYLYGASPALCSSFISHKDVSHKFDKVGKGTLYMPYATSLRMSDLGYTSSAQSNLKICYNDLSTYVSSVRGAIGKKAPDYAHLSSDEENGWQQLNDNVLQIENELYSPIRPKQVAKSQEMPTNALEDRGVSYLEVRSLDVNPYSPVGIEVEQFHFLDVFLVYCLLTPSAKFDDVSLPLSQQNITNVVEKGRDPALLLNNNGKLMLLKDWGEELIIDLRKVATLLDEAKQTDVHMKAVIQQHAKFMDPSITPSGKWLKILLDNEIDNSVLGLELAKKYKADAQNTAYTHISQADFVAQAISSIKAREEIESQDDKNFTQFVNDYFGKRVAGDPNA
ncbi:MAG: glutamate--cysteine ligase [Alphaproteobacteria bacterium]|jgi:glutamate--cysteine ligase